MQSNYIEVCIKTEVDSGELLGMLNEGETLGSWEKDGVLHIFWPEERWNDAALEDLKNVLGAMGESAPEDLTIAAVPDQDWNATWAASLQPIRLGRRVRIRQSWHEADPGFTASSWSLIPSARLAPDIMRPRSWSWNGWRDSVRGGERVLDVGTGSGILAMCAIRFGAASALGIDNDPVAVECAREYAAGNGFGAELDLKVAAFDALGRREV